MLGCGSFDVERDVEALMKERDDLRRQIIESRTAQNNIIATERDSLRRQLEEEQRIRLPREQELVNVIADLKQKLGAVDKLAEDFRKENYDLQRKLDAAERECVEAKETLESVAPIIDANRSFEGLSLKIERAIINLGKLNVQ